jgi:HlyD family secretion protein
MIKWATIILSVVGLGAAVFVVATAEHAPPPAPLASEPSINPYEHGLAATGLVEAASRNINIAAPEGGGIVARVFVQVGEQVAAGAPLFELETQQLRAELVRARAGREAAEAAMARVEAHVRPEEFAPLEAAARAAEADLADATDRYDRLIQAQTQTAAADGELRRAMFAVQSAEARLAQARSQVDLARAGAWGPELALARSQVNEAEANIRSLEMLIERRTVRSPIDATVLKRNIEAGEFAPADARSAAVVIGDLTSVHVRAQVDEEDLPRLREGAMATARIRGRDAITAPLRMLRIEPLAQPKTQLSGATMERVDTRVVDVIFVVVDPEGRPLFPGQLVDVFIEAPAGVR